VDGWIVGLLTAFLLLAAELIERNLQ